MKEEVEMLKDEQVIKNEQLLRFEKHCDALSSEVNSYLLIKLLSSNSTRSRTMIC